MSALGVISIIVVSTICLLVLMTAVIVVIAVGRAAREDEATLFRGDEA